MLDKESKSEDRVYRSPARKLVKFSEESCDQWRGGDALKFLSF